MAGLGFRAGGWTCDHTFWANVYDVWDTGEGSGGRSKSTSSRSPHQPNGTPRLSLFLTHLLSPSDSPNSTKRDPVLDPKIF